MTADEFNRAQEFYMGQLMLALEDTLDHMLWVGETTAMLDRTYSLGEIIKEVKRVARDDVRRVAQLIFKDENLSLALIGPIESERSRFSRLLTVA